MYKSLILLFLFLSVNLYSVATDNKPVIIDASKERVIKDVFTLASDSMRGRKFPDTGRVMAANYIAGQFESVGLKGINYGDEPYFQKIPVSKIDRGETLIYYNGSPYYSGLSMYSFAATKALNIGSHDSPAEMPVKFVGYSSGDMVGYTGKDTLVFFLAEDMVDATRRLEELAENTGAKFFGFAVREERKKLTDFFTSEVQEIISTENSISGYQYPDGVFGMSTIEESDWLYNYLPVMDNDIGVFLFDESFFTIFFDESLKDRHNEALLAEREGVLPEPVYKDLKFTTSFQLMEVVKYDDNVIGYIEGADLKEEVVIICGHYDHLGKRGDNIHYGADDNASGTAAVMELARMFVQAKSSGVEFRRSVVFIAFGAEESGLNGSSYYVANPVFPLDKTALVINMDMIGRADHPVGEAGYASVHVMSGLRRPLWRTFRRIDKSMDNIVLERAGLSFGSLMYYFGSDHYPFVKKGIPAVVVNTGMHPDYHKPTDTPDKINYDNLTNIIKVVFAIAAKVADEPEKFPLN